MTYIFNQVWESWRTANAFLWCKIQFQLQIEYQSLQNIETEQKKDSVFF